MILKGVKVVRRRREKGDGCVYNEGHYRKG